MLEQLKKLMKDEEAPTAVEYALMVAGIAVVVMGTVFILGGSIKNKFTAVDNQINTIFVVRFNKLRYRWPKCLGLPILFMQRFLMILIPEIHDISRKVNKDVGV